MTIPCVSIKRKARIMLILLAAVLLYLSVRLERNSLRLFRTKTKVLPKVQAANESSCRTSTTDRLENDQICLRLLYSSEVGRNESTTVPVADETTDKQVLRELDKGCESFKRRFLFGINEDPIHITEEERRYPIAYSILAHINANQLVQLLSAIYAPQNVYCIHVDQKASDDIKKLVSKLGRCFPNVFRSSKSETVIYAGFSRLQADINCMSDLLESNNSWKHLINLCGQDFPLSTNYETVRQLKALNGLNSIGGHLPSNINDLARTLYVHQIVNQTQNGKTEFSIKRTSKKKTPPPFNMTVYKNMAYNVFARPFLDWALRKSKKAKALLDWSRDTYSPDEHYWKMLDALRGEAPGASSRNDEWQISRHVVWFDSKQRCDGHWRHYHCTFAAGDLHRIIKTRALFVNKFDVTYDSRAPTCVRKWLDERKRRIDLRNAEKLPRKP